MSQSHRGSGLNLQCLQDDTNLVVDDRIRIKLPQRDTKVELRLSSLTSLFVNSLRQPLSVYHFNLWSKI